MGLGLFNQVVAATGRSNHFARQDIHGTFYPSYFKTSNNGPAL